MRRGASLVAVLLIAGCTSAATRTTSSQTPPPSIPEPTVTTTSSPPAPPVSLARYWRAMKYDMKKNWHALCLPFVCGAVERLLDVNVSYAHPGGRDSITASCVGGLRDNTECSLVLSGFASYFSTTRASHGAFAGAVTDAMDALPVGHSLTRQFPPVEIVVEHPTAAKWQFTVQQP